MFSIAGIDLGSRVLRAAICSISATDACGAPVILYSLSAFPHATLFSPVCQGETSTGVKKETDSGTRSGVDLFFAVFPDSQIGGWNQVYLVMPSAAHSALADMVMVNLIRFFSLNASSQSRNRSTWASLLSRMILVKLSTKTWVIS